MSPPAKNGCVFFCQWVVLMLYLNGVSGDVAHGVEDGVEYPASDAASEVDCLRSTEL